MAPVRTLRHRLALSGGAVRLLSRVPGRHRRGRPDDRPSPPGRDLAAGRRSLRRADALRPRPLRRGGASGGQDPHPAERAARSGAARGRAAPGPALCRPAQSPRRAWPCWPRPRPGRAHGSPSSARGARGRAAGHPALDLRGALPPDAVQAAMARACALVVPSLWYEGLPMVVAEAFAGRHPGRRLAHRGARRPRRRRRDRPPRRARRRRRSRPRAGPHRPAIRWPPPRWGGRPGAVYARAWHEDVTTRALLDIYRDAVAARAADAPLARTGT